jgi:hypothetical protein
MGLFVLAALGGIVTLATPAGAAPDDDQVPMKKKKSDRRATSPEATALMLRLLDRYVENKSDKSEMDKRVGQALDKIKNGRQIAQRLRNRFEALDQAEKHRLLGQHLPLVKAPRIPDSRFERTLSQMERHGSGLAFKLPDLDRFDTDLPSRTPGGTAKAPKRDDFDPAGRDEAGSASRPVAKNVIAAGRSRAQIAGARAQYRIEYKGLRARSETDGLGDDEIYIITTALGSTTTTTKQPTGGGYGENEYYTDIDSGDRRRGPSQVVWSGAAETITLNVAVWEQDSSDPEAVREDVEFTFSLAEAVAKALNAPGWVNLALGFADDLVIALIGLLEDDLIQQRVVEIRAAELARYVDQVDDSHQLQEWNGIRYHFYTRHRGDGGDYYIFYRVYRD